MIAVATSLVAVVLVAGAIWVALLVSHSERAPIGSSTPLGPRAVIGTPMPNPSANTESVTSTGIPIPRSTDINGASRLRELVRLDDCGATADGWYASGTATWRGTGNHSLILTIVFTDSASRAVFVNTTDVAVAAGSTATWSSRISMVAPVGTRCVLAGVAERP